MKKRFKMNRRKSKKNFSKTARRTNKRNIAGPLKRGGTRL